MLYTNCSYHSITKYTGTYVQVITIYKENLNGCLVYCINSKFRMQDDTDRYQVAINDIIVINRKFRMQVDTDRYQVDINDIIDINSNFSMGFDADRYLVDINDIIDINSNLVNDINACI